MTDRTHYEGCWRETGHHECAKAKLVELARVVIEFDNEYKVDGLYYAEICNRLFELAQEVIRDE